MSDGGFWLCETISCELLLSAGEQKENDSAYCRMSLVVVVALVRLRVRRQGVVVRHCRSDGVSLHAVGSRQTVLRHMQQTRTGRRPGRTDHTQACNQRRLPSRRPGHLLQNDRVLQLLQGCQEMLHLLRQVQNQHSRYVT